MPPVTPEGKHSYQSFCVFLENRDTVMQTMRDQGIETQIGTYSLHMHKAFAQSDYCRHAASGFPGSRYAFDHCLTLPMYHEMTKDEQEYVVQKLQEAIDGG